MINLNQQIIDLTEFSFGERLALIRGVKSKKQQEVAADLNLSSKNLSKWETGESKPSMEDLEKLANYYNISLDFIIKGVASSNKDKQMATEMKKLSNANSLTKEFNEVLKPFGRFSTEEKSKLYKIMNDEIYVNVRETVATGDIDLYKILSSKYKMYDPTKNIQGSFPHKLTLDEAVETNNLEFYKLALEDLNKENVAREQYNERMRAIHYNFNEQKPINIQWELSKTLEKVVERYLNSDSDDLIQWLLDNGACMIRHYIDYPDKLDMIQTSIIKRLIKNNK